MCVFTITVISGRQFDVVNNDHFNYVINYVISNNNIISQTIDDNNNSNNNNNTDPVIIDYVSAINVSIDVVVSCTVW